MAKTLAERTWPGYSTVKPKSLAEVLGQGLKYDTSKKPILSVSSAPVPQCRASWWASQPALRDPPCATRATLSLLVPTAHILVLCLHWEVPLEDG